jgi:hypothetical protein
MVLPGTKYHFLFRMDYMHVPVLPVTVRELYPCGCDVLPFCNNSMDISRAQNGEVGARRIGNVECLALNPMSYYAGEGRVETQHTVAEYDRVFVSRSSVFGIIHVPLGYRLSSTPPQLAIKETYIPIPL